MRSKRIMSNKTKLFLSGDTTGPCDAAGACDSAEVIVTAEATSEETPKTEGSAASLECLGTWGIAAAEVEEASKARRLRRRNSMGWCAGPSRSDEAPECVAAKNSAQANAGPSEKARDTIASTVSLGALQLQERMAVIRVWVACSEAEGTDVAHIPLELVHRFREIIVPTVAVVLAVE